MSDDFQDGLDRAVVRRQRDERAPVVREDVVQELAQASAAPGVCLAVIWVPEGIVLFEGWLDAVAWVRGFDGFACPAPVAGVHA